MGAKKSPADALHYAYVGLDAAAAAALDSEAAFPPNRASAVIRIRGLVKNQGAKPRDATEYAALTNEIGEVMTRYTSQIKCDGQSAPFYFYVYNSTLSKNVVQAQAEWLKAARGCTFPADVVESALKLQKIANENTTIIIFVKSTIRRPHLPSRR